MANPRQRRKARSSSHTAVQHAKHAKRNLKKMKPIRGPASETLRGLWNNRKTVKQNYASLGLIHNLNPSLAGGVEVTQVFAEKDVVESPSEPVASTSTIPSDTIPSIPKGYGKIIRDEAGKVLGVEFAEEEKEETAGSDGEGVDAVMEPADGILDKWVVGMGGPATSRSQTAVKSLESISVTTSNSKNTISASITGVGARHASVGEKAYLQRLLDKYGGNISAMAKDRKLNSEQRTEAQLRRALNRAGFL
ncbi:ribosome biogenesis protein Nop16 [Mycena floridula]|nr:ribosome biogenesis protein Nop16 [Mycena floridula]